MIDALDGAGVTYKGHVIVADGRKATFFDTDYVTTTPLLAKPAPRSRQQPVTERILVKRGKLLGKVSGPDDAAIVNQLSSCVSITTINCKPCYEWIMYS